MISLYSYETAVGSITIAENGAAIVRVSFEKEDPEMNETMKETPLLREAANQLTAYFSGQRTTFSLPLAPNGTPFQQKVWHALLQIPYGETRSYLEIAHAIGNPKACRAVGMANHRNPIAILIPCHRVIGSNGGLVGYASGVAIKEQLLRLEQTHRSQP